jgi:hypothetical protein
MSERVAAPLDSAYCTPTAYRLSAYALTSPSPRGFGGVTRLRSWLAVTFLIHSPLLPCFFLPSFPLFDFHYSSLRRVCFSQSVATHVNSYLFDKSAVLHLALIMGVPDNGPVIAATTWSLTLLCGTFLGLRIYAKVSRKQSLWWDDHILIISWVSSPIISFNLHTPPLLEHQSHLNNICSKVISGVLRRELCRNIQALFFFPSFTRHNNTSKRTTHNPIYSY